MPKSTSRPYPPELPDAVARELLGLWDWALGDATAFVVAGTAAALYATGDYDVPTASWQARRIVPEDLEWTEALASEFLAEERLSPAADRQALESLMLSPSGDGRCYREVLAVFAAAVLHGLRSGDLQK